MSKTMEVRIGNRPYKMAVEDGQETRVRSVAEQFDQFVGQVKQAAGDMERDRLLVSAAMMLSDELLTLRGEHETQQQSIAAFHETLAERLEKLVA